MSLSLIQEPGGSSFLRYHDCEQDTKQDSQPPKYKEHDPPARDRHIRIAKCIHEDTSDDLADPVHRDPCSDAHRMLLLTVPIGREDNEGRRHCSLGKT